MEKEKFERILIELDSVSNIDELRNILEQIHEYLFEVRLYRDEEQNKILFTKLAIVASNLQHSFDFVFSDRYGGYNLMGISFNSDSHPKVYTGYKYFKWTITPSGHREREEREIREIKELNVDNEDITRVSYLPVVFGENFKICLDQNESEQTQFKIATTALYDELKAQYQRKKQEENPKMKLLK